MVQKNKKNNSNKWLTIGLVVLGVIILFSLLISPYNKLVSYDENTIQAWGNVEVQYQRRADLIPNLVSTVQGFAAQEKSVLIDVTAARSAWASAKSAGNRPAQMAAANQMDGALSRLLVTVEAYPDLKSNQNFLALQDELAGTENRVSVARIRYNEAVATYNKYVRKFPSNTYASLFNFNKKESFTADEGSQKAPEVSF